jgi:hypothetical protein
MSSRRKSRTIACVKPKRRHRENPPIVHEAEIVDVDPNPRRLDPVRIEPSGAYVRLPGISWVGDHELGTVGAEIGALIEGATMIVGSLEQIRRALSGGGKRRRR